MRNRNLIIRLVVCVSTGISAATAITIHGGDRVCHWSSAERTLHLLSGSFLRVQHRNGERVFSVVPLNRTKEPALTLGVAF